MALKTHSMVSRRDFMKALGFGTVGAAAAAASVPVFHDVDELLSTSEVVPKKRPWWIKERELFSPTSEVDWNMMKRFNRNNEAHTRRVNTMYRTPEEFDAANARRTELNNKRNLDASGEKGYDRKWNALYAGGNSGMEAYHRNYLGISTASQITKSPDELKIAPWQGTPEEGSKLLYAAMRFFGAIWIGFNNIEEHWRNNLIVETTTDAARDWTWTAANPTPPATDDNKYIFDDVKLPELRNQHTGSMKRPAGEMVIPRNGASIIAFATGASMEATKGLWSTYAKSNSASCNNMHEVIGARVQNFVRALGGWTAWGLMGHQTAETNFAGALVLTGIAENSRNGCYVLTPEVGPNHIPCSFMTNMPIAPTNPIDAGLWRFCHSCHKCAKVCPSGCISDDKEPSWEIPAQKSGKARVFNNPGLKHFWADMPECVWYYQGGTGQSGCWTCYANCTFSEDKAAMIHNMVRATVAQTSIFNGFFASMSKPFGFGPYEDPDIWWDMALPAFGFDTTIGAGKGY